MFDWISCDYHLPDGKTHEKGNDPAPYQTKDLENGLNVYRITTDGRLFFETWGEWYGKDEPGEYIKHTGNVSFYGGGDGMADIYTASFTDGQLNRIVTGWGREEAD